MGAALALAARGRGVTGVNPAVGCLIVRDGIVVGRGSTAAGGRPHAEAAALAQAGDAARGATAYVTLEPCAHVSQRGPDCAGLLAAAGVARVVAAARDPDPRTAGKGLQRLTDAGVNVTYGVGEAEARAVAAGFFSRIEREQPFVTLKLALSLDGCVALASGVSRWLTGELARAHAHLERSRADLIVVGRGTLEADDPALDVRLPGLKHRSPAVAVLSRTLAEVPAGMRLTGARVLRDLNGLDGVNEVLVEGGTGVATSLLADDLVDRLLIYRAPLLLGGKLGIGALGLADLSAAHGRWRLAETRDLGPDRLEVYDRAR